MHSYVCCDACQCQRPWHLTWFYQVLNKKRDINATRLLKTRSNFSKSAMVSEAVSSSYRAKVTVALLDQETPDFIPPALWPPNSPDLNPVDYTVRSVLQERVYRTKISNVDELKRRISSEWTALSHAVIERAVSEWRQRLRTCVRAGGEHFEHML